MTPLVSIRNLSKTYATDFKALAAVDLEIRRGEIL
ncbi:MAG: multidrug ABC transporter ATP-binding protein, partial [Proteobacteria bacterium]|nr:multidrug ABC transporter ATP-binding protein [Pseudomonadota bacterium]